MSVNENGRDEAPYQSEFCSTMKTSIGWRSRFRVIQDGISKLFTPMFFYPKANIIVDLAYRWASIDDLDWIFWRRAAWGGLLREIFREGRLQGDSLRRPAGENSCA
jgi:hypothetical protein